LAEPSAWAAAVHWSARVVAVAVAVAVHWSARVVAVAAVVVAAAVHWLPLPSER